MTASGVCRLGNKPLTITFAEPRRADTDQSQDIKSIFVGNLPDSATQEKLSEVHGILAVISHALVFVPHLGCATMHSLPVSVSACFAHVN